LFKPSEIYNAQDVLKNHFLQVHPFVFTKDGNDATQVSGTSSPTGFVWLVEEGHNLYRTFPWYVKTSKKNTVIQFPQMYKNFDAAKSHTVVQLVPVDVTGDYQTETGKHVPCEADAYNGHSRYDIFCLSAEVMENSDIEGLKFAHNIAEAQEKSETDFLWIVPDDVDILKDFDFVYKPEPWSLNYVHLFRNGRDSYDGVIFLSKYREITDKEEKFRHYRKMNFVDRQASTPVAYEIFTVNEYEDYLSAVYSTKTRMFWGITPTADIPKDFDFKYFIPSKDKTGLASTHGFVNAGVDTGVYLFSTSAPVTKEEFDTKTFANAKEKELVSKPAPDFN